MSTTAAHDLDVLTAKTQRVYHLLEAGKTRPEIAREMKITRSAIYAHERRMREHGIEPPSANDNGQHSSSNGASQEPIVASDGRITEMSQRAIEALRDVRQTVGVRQAEIDGRVVQMQAELDRMKAESAELATMDEGYKAALEALTI